MNEPTHIDLFSGIGGFALAAQWAGFRTVAFCEIEPLCQAVLAKNFGAVIADADGPGFEARPVEGGPSNPSIFKNASANPVLFSDIRKLDGRRHLGVSLFTAGVPCQPASCAGKRRGTSDDRWLWPEAFRVIREAQPLVCVFENPTGILSLESGMVFESLLSDLESFGYEVAPPIIVPACAVGAGHRRYRCFVVAHLNAMRESQPKGSKRDKWRRVGNGACNAPNLVSPRLEVREEQHARSECAAAVGGSGIVRPETDLGLLRAVHGLPNGMDRNRRARIHALGNAVVPAQVYPILKTIRELIA